MRFPSQPEESVRAAKNIGRSPWIVFLFLCTRIFKHSGLADRADTKQMHVLATNNHFREMICQSWSNLQTQVEINERPANVG